MNKYVAPQSTQVFLAHLLNSRQFSGFHAATTIIMTIMVYTKELISHMEEKLDMAVTGHTSFLEVQGYFKYLRSHTESKLGLERMEGLSLNKPKSLKQEVIYRCSVVVWVLH